MRRIWLSLAAVALGATATLPASAASTYSQPTFGTPWDTFSLDILIVPPEHGQLVNGYGALNGWDTREVTPFENSYVRAIERSISNWRRAIKAYGPSSLSSRVKINDYVIGRDEVPQAALRDPEGVIVTAPHQLDVLGVTFHFGAMGTKCVISNARFFTASFSYTDMLNVSTHEFGHCLGADHVVGGLPAKDVLVDVYVHDIGVRATPRMCPSNLNIKTINRAFGRMFNRSAAGTITIPKRDYRQISC